MSNLLFETPTKHFNPDIWSLPSTQESISKVNYNMYVLGITKIVAVEDIKTTSDKGAFSPEELGGLIPDERYITLPICAIDSVKPDTARINVGRINSITGEEYEVENIGGLSVAEATKQAPFTLTDGIDEFLSVEQIDFIHQSYLELAGTGLYGSRIQSIVGLA